MKPTVGSLFAGIGGFDLGFERAGFETVWQVEIDDYCRRVLERHFPRAERFGDIRECAAHNLKRVDVITGGFPCQPFSDAGRRMGTEDDRYLWPEMLRVISALRPNFVVAENVAGFIALEDGRILDQVYTDLEGQSYECLPPLMVPAASFGAWHRRDRVWICAHAMRSIGSAEPEQQQKEWTEVIDGICSTTAYASEQGLQSRQYVRQSANAAKNKAGMESEPQRCSAMGFGEQWAIEPNVGRVAHGVSRRVDRLRGLGNAVVPQIAQWIAERIKAVMEA